jgi:glutathione synthase/RimK-type ligase-like ATP-grasp enzyme
MTSLIHAAGFQVPETLITTNPDAVRDFYRNHEAVIYKSISGIRSIVSRLTPQHLARLNDVQWCPSQFQEYVPGSDFRVHVVGSKVFAARVSSTADDYRYASRQGATLSIEACELSDDVGARCVTLARSLQLNVAGADLRRTPEGEWYCFEVNPSPGFSFYQDATKQPIARSIAELLAAATT